MTWDERYRKGDHVDLAPMEFLVQLAGRIEAGSTVLDLACGAGRHAALFAERGCCVVAIDSSDVALEIVRSRGMDIVTIAADTEQSSCPPDAYDLIIVTMYLDRGLFRKIRQGVKPGGRVAMAIPLVDEREGVKPMNPAYLLRPGELAAEFAGWDFEHQVETQPDPPARRIAEIIAVRPA